MHTPQNRVKSHPGPGSSRTGVARGRVHSIVPYNMAIIRYNAMMKQSTLNPPWLPVRLRGGYMVHAVSRPPVADLGRASICSV